MVWFYIALVVILILLLICLILAISIHNKYFSNRFVADSLTRYYTKDEFGLSENVVSFSCNKRKLKGAFYSKNIEYPNNLIIFCHGMWSSRKAYMQDIAYYCQNGFEVFSYDAYGVDESEGNSIVGLGMGLKALDSAINYVKSIDAYKDKNIIVIGHSWGGFCALNIVKYHPNIKKVIALAPFISINQVLKGMLPKKLGFVAYFITIIDFFKCGFYSLENAKKNLKKYNGDAYIIHSLDDNMVNYNLNTGLLKKNLPNYSNILIETVNNKIHNPQYTENAVKLLNEYLAKLHSLDLTKQKELKSQTNFHDLGELDLDIMDKIEKFILK